MFIRKLQLAVSCKRCVKKLFKPIVQFFFSDHSALSFVSTNKLCLPVS